MNIRQHILILLFVGVFVASVLAGQGVSATAAAPEKAPSPHTDSGDCSLCHVAPADKLRSWFAFGSTKRELIADPSTLCRKCHGVSFGHGVGSKPAMNLGNLPLDAQGKIACAITCHNMHVSGVEDQRQLRYHLRYPVNELCKSCHKQ